jgi:peptidoglycan/LPS O-acetylase OafA/YrhL
MDTLRIVAAVTVFFGHAYAQWNTTEGYNYHGIDWGHVAVVVFFTLSGYVIGYTTTANNRGPLRYAQARLSRLYSVLIPTLLITGAIELIVKLSDPALLVHYTRGVSFPRYILSGLFLNEVWFFSASPPINGPLWSLSFEFWYYVIFGAFFFSGKGIKGKILPLLACLIAGPKILLMMPIWLLGYLSYRIYSPVKRYTLSWFFVFLFAGLSVLLVYILPAMPLRLGQAPLFFAGQFITDLIIGVFVALALWMLPQRNNKSVNKNNILINAIRKLADLTFPLYVLHDPLLVLIRSFWKTRLFDTAQMWTVIVIVFVLSMLLGVMMEKGRKRWVTFFGKILFFGRRNLPVSHLKL